MFADVMHPPSTARGAFRLLFAGQPISALGDRLVPVSLAFAMLDVTGSVTDLGSGGRALFALPAAHAPQPN
jgi:hypothetical protein